MKRRRRPKPFPLRPPRLQRPLETAEATKTSEKAADKKAKKAKRTRNLRRLRYGSTSTAITVVVIAAVVLLNIIVGIVAERFPVTLDLSANKVYSMSDESIAVAESVKDDLQIVVFMSEETFSNSTTGSSSGVPEFDTTMKEFYNILKQYRSHSDNRVSYSFIDPDQELTKFAAYSIYEVQAGDILFIYGNRAAHAASAICTPMTAPIITAPAATPSNPMWKRCWPPISIP